MSIAPSIVPIKLIHTESIMWYCFGNSETLGFHDRVTVDLDTKTLDGARAGYCKECGVTYISTKPR